MEQLQRRDNQRQGIDLLPRPTLDLLPEYVTGIMLKDLSKMEHFKIQIIHKISAGHFEKSVRQHG
jgi:hypothetical protein